MLRKSISTALSLGLIALSVQDGLAAVLVQNAPAQTGVSAPSLAVPTAQFSTGLKLEGMSSSLQLGAALPNVSVLPTPSIAASPSLSLLETKAAPVQVRRIRARPVSTLKQVSEPKQSQAAASVVQQMRQASDIVSQAAREDKTPAESAGSWRSFWSGSIKTPVSPDLVDAAPLPLRHLSKSLSPAKSIQETARPRGIPAPAVLVGITLPAWAGSAFKVVLPYAEAVGVLGATYGLTRLASWSLEKLWKAKGWDRNLLIVTRMTTNIVLWTAGATVALNFAGMDWSSIMTGLGVGTLVVTMSVKKFLGNFIQGIMVLSDHPFRIGERVRIGQTEYTVKDMSFRYMVLEKEPGTHTLMDYTTLSGMPLRLHRRLDRKAELAKSRSQAQAPKGFSWRKGLFLTGAAGALGYAYYLAQTGMAALQPYVYGAMALGATILLARLVDRILRRIGAKQGWDENRASLARMLVSGLIHVVGIVAALSLMGVSWTALLAGAGVLSVGVTVAATDIVGNLLEAGSILLTQPFKLGDRIRVGDAEGTVVDMGLRHVVLEVDEGGKPETILVPYAMISGSTLTVFKEYAKRRDP
ncbi:MAG: mechanosensitive ion channel domain-containing protein [Elusimicrobiota bacterium]